MMINRSSSESLCLAHRAVLFYFILLCVGFYGDIVIVV